MSLRNGLRHEVRRWAFGDETKLYTAGSGQQLKRHEQGWRVLDRDVLSALEQILARRT